MQTVELHWDSKLRKPNDLFEASLLCGLPLHNCNIEGCTRDQAVTRAICQILSGKQVYLHEFVRDLLNECSAACGCVCGSGSDIKRRIEESSNAYFSPDGKKFLPDPTSSRPENRFSRYECYMNRIVMDQRKTADESIVSMGSCFMHEINKLLVEERLLARKHEKWCETSHCFSAAWGTVFTPLSAQFALEYYFDIRERPYMTWKSDHLGSPMVFDVFREDVIFRSEQEHRYNIDLHKSQARMLLESCKFFLCAFSMTETWLTNDGSNYPLARSPWRINPLAARPHDLGFEEIRQSIGLMSNLFERFNPSCKILIGVDPVPLHATHGNQNSIIADSHAKAKLLAATHSCVQERANMYYVPFYETIHYCSLSPWQSDERHVKNEYCERAFHELMRILETVEE